MKWLAILLLAGCTQAPVDCHWEIAPDTHFVTIFWHPEDPAFYKTGQVVPMRATYLDGIPDQYLVSFAFDHDRGRQSHILVHDGVLQAFAFDNTTGEPLSFTPGNPTTFPAGRYENFTLVVALNPDGPAMQRDIRLDWEFTPTGNESMAEVVYSAKVSYRIC